jgi:hypothetical protein
MPISCEMNGFQLANIMMNYDGTATALLLYLLFISAVAGVIIGILLLMEKKVKIFVDWIILIACIGSGLFVFFGSVNNGPSLQTGAYVILIGWIVALLAQIISTIKKEV